MKKILLHVCCGPCAIYVVKRLQEDGFKVTLYFYNPNVQPEEEYLRRKNEVEHWSQKENLDLIISPYKPEEWLKSVRGLEDCEEGGERCQVCYNMRIEDTAQYASLNGFAYFGTTLTISPHKSATVINKIGREIMEKINKEAEQGLNKWQKIIYYEADWKKHDGFKMACELSHAEGFYRQNYCGCIYSRISRNV